MNYLPGLLALTFILLSSCSDSGTDGTLVSDTTQTSQPDSLPSIAPDTAQKQLRKTSLAYSTEDASNLLLFEKFSLGITYHELKQKMPGLKNLHAEDNNEQLALKGLKESVQDVYFLNYKGKLEFNFKNDSLYRYSIVFTETNEQKSTQLYEQLLEYYNEHLGNFEPVNTEEDNHYAQLHTWYLNPDYLIAIYNLNTGNITIAAQTNKPGQQQ